MRTSSKEEWKKVFNNYLNYNNLKEYIWFLEDEQYAISNNTYNDYTWRTFKIYLFERMLSRINEIIKCEEKDNFNNYNGNYTISNKRFVKEVKGYLTMSIADFPSYLRQNNLLKNCEEW